MTGRKWWIGLVAALALALAGPAAAEENDDSADVSAALGANTEAMYEFLVAEVAAQRGDLESALAIYHRLARELKSPVVARRAVEVAIRARAFASALESSTLLLELDPESAFAREMMATLLANESDLTKARAVLARILEKSSNRASLLMQLPYLLSKFPDKGAMLETTQAVAEPYNVPEARYAVGLAALLAGRMDRAEQEADAALAMKPGWPEGAILKAQALRRHSPAEVLRFYEGFVKEHPGAVEVRKQLGREYASERKLAEAREQFREVEKLVKDDAQSAYAVGLLALQLEDYADAQTAFTRALKMGYREATAIYLGLGQAAEGLKNYEEAISWYKKVDSNDWVRAQLKIATLMARQQGLEAGRQYLQKIEPRAEEDRIQIIQVEAQLLRESKAWNETYDVLSKAVKSYPDSYELLYDRAMAAERIDKLDVLEKDLRRVIVMKPDYAHAYNALGYTLAEKTQRLSEAKDLIEKAYKLSPDDPFILDSLGWVYYRLGQVDVALKHLQSAYDSRPDPEIAAHLGEVLWKSGKRDAAQKIWRAALAENPNHESLLAVIQKYRP